VNGEIAPAAGEMRFHIPLVKIDVERRLVIGRAAQEVVDKSNEIMDYASAKPQFEKWSNSFSSATNGLSKGNLRVMHTKHVAGKIQDLSFDDNDKSIHVMAYVSDDNDWKKCLDGSYTGFSMGGGYLKKWNDNGVTRYTPDIRELSLVDSPCIPTARFAELVKADGVVEQIRLRGRVALFDDLFKADTGSFDQMWKSRPVLFDEMMKAFDGTKHPREYDGKFAGKHAENAALTVGGAAGAAGGYLAGALHGERAGKAAGLAGARLYNKAKNYLSQEKNPISRAFSDETREMNGIKIGGFLGRRFGPLAAASAGGAALGLGAAAVGAKLDQVMRRRRAMKAGKLDQYNRLNADVSVKPNSVKQAKGVAVKAMRHGRKLQNYHSKVSGWMG
jgi:hypothetical protein